MTAYVVTTSVAGVSRTQVWKPEQPLSVGHPLQWIIEQTPEGVRARNLGGHTGKLRSQGVQLIRHEDLLNGTEIALPALDSSGRAGMLIRIRRAKDVAPIYGDTQGARLALFRCHKDWCLDSQLLDRRAGGSPVSGRWGKRELFRLQATQNGFQLKSLVADLAVGTRTIGQGETVELSAAELPGLIIRSEALSWRFGRITEAPAIVDDKSPQADPETAWFKLALRYAGIAFGVFALTATFWPKPKKSDELIPAQFTKIVLSKPQKPQSSEEPSGGGKTTATAKVQQTAVVQAFRAKALRNSINGLLKGGMTRLLAQSDFLSGSVSTAEAKRLFDSKSNALRATGAETGYMNSKSVAVASLGGSGGGVGGGTGAGVGYGKGQHASVRGQGTGQVSMDIGGGSVEEGLSKEEVGEVIHKHMSEVRYCYEAAMLRTPGIEGRLIINFTIGGTGNVTASEVKSSTLPDPRLDDCILRRLVTWKFPQTKGGIDVAVSYPFIFKTLGK